MSVLYGMKRELVLNPVSVEVGLPQSITVFSFFVVLRLYDAVHIFRRVTALRA